MLRHQKIDTSIPLEEFDCGNQKLNQYLQKHALENDRRGISACLLFFNESNQLVGYLCWNAASYGKEGFPPKEARGLPGYPIPALLISRLAVDIKFKGKGFGGDLLFFAFEHAIVQTQNPTAPAFRFLVVDAIDDTAISFYKHFGFKQFSAPPSRLYITMGTVIKAWESQT